MRPQKQNWPLEGDASSAFVQFPSQNRVRETLQKRENASKSGWVSTHFATFAGMWG